MRKVSNSNTSWILWLALDAAPCLVPISSVVCHLCVCRFSRWNHAGSSRLQRRWWYARTPRNGRTPGTAWRDGSTRCLWQQRRLPQSSTADRFVLTKGRLDEAKNISWALVSPRHGPWDISSRYHILLFEIRSKTLVICQFYIWSRVWKWSAVLTSVCVLSWWRKPVLWLPVLVGCWHSDEQVLAVIWKDCGSLEHKKRLGTSGDGWCFQWQCPNSAGFIRCTREDRKQEGSVCFLVFFGIN